MDKIKLIIEELLNSKVLSINKASHGAESDAYIFTLKDGRTLVGKFPKRKENNYLFETIAYKELNKLNINTPSLVAYNEALIITLIEGETLDDKEELFSRKDIFEDSAKDLAKVHSVKFDKFGYLDKYAYLKDKIIQGELNNWSDYFSNTLDLLSSLENDKYINRKEAKLIKDFWNDVLPNISIERGSLLHGDFCLGHIFVKKDKTLKFLYSGIIDFGDAFIGDPLMDIAYYKYKEINKPYGKEIYDNFLKSYVSNANLPDNYNKRILFYMLYWGILRASSFYDKDIRMKFIDKLRMVVDEILDYKK